MNLSLRSFIGSLLVAGLMAAMLAPPVMAEGPAIGQPAPEFSGKNIQGKTVKLSDLKGKIVVLEWTNPGCPFVQRHYKKAGMPALQKEYTEKGIVWITVNSTNKDHRDYRGASELKKIYGDWNASFSDLVLDPEGTIGKLYDAKTTPDMFVIDTKGILQYKGAIDNDPRGSKESDRLNYVRQALDALLAGKSVETTDTTPYGCSVKY
jgi:alkyl hydroperoxide reductase subunit AhpC